MLRPGGHGEVIGGAGTFVCFEVGKRVAVTSNQHEIDTWTCAHCNHVVHAPVRAKDTDYFFCRNCMARICDPCANHPCVPFLKKIEKQEALDRALRSYGV